MPAEPLCIGINGFGPMGRHVLYAALQNPKMSVAAINDPSFSAACMAYMMEHERPSHLPLLHVEAVSESAVAINGTHRVAILQETRPTKWAEHGAQVVIECTGTNTTRERCSSHLTFGAQHVIVAAHSVDIPLVAATATSSRSEAADKEGRLVCAHSCGSRLGAVLAPFLSLMDATLGLEEVSYTAVSGLSDEADPAAGRSANPLEWRQLRLQQSTATGKGAFAPSATHTGTATVLKRLPKLSGRLTATAFQVPGHKGCAVDLHLRTEKAATKTEVDDIICGAASVAGATTPVVRVVGLPASVEGTTVSGAMISTDCLGADSLLYDMGVSTTTMSGHSHKLLLWVDLEWAYAKQVISAAEGCAAAASGNCSSKSTMTGPI